MSDLTHNQTSGTSPTLLSKWLAPPQAGVKIKRASNYRVAEWCLQRLVPFKHSTLSGGWEQDRYGDNRWTFVVKSYSTAVAVFTPAQRVEDVLYGAEEWITDTRYSVTTSKHLGKVRAQWDGFGRLLETEDAAFAAEEFMADHFEVHVVSA